MTARASKTGFFTPLVAPHAPAVSVLPSMIKASVSTVPADVRTEPSPALNVGLFSRSTTAAVTASTTLSPRSSNAQPIRAALGTVATLDELDRLLAGIDPDQPHPSEVAAGPRGRTTGQRRVALPEGWLESCVLGVDQDLAAAEVGVSGG